MNKNLNTRRIAQLVGLVLTSALLAPMAQAEVAGEIGVTNDYRFRGISQTAGDFAVQADLYYSMENGIFFGAWASNVDDDSYDADVEVDLYAGYAGAFGADDAVEYDVTLTYYTYPGQDDSSRYLEASVGFYYENFHFAQWYTNNYANADIDMHYSELNYSYEFVENWSIDAHVGYSYGDGADFDWGESYMDYSVGVSTEVAGVGLSLAWLDTNLSSDNEIKDGPFTNKGTILFSASYAF
ncbi:TorF family putative porin [Shewanella sp. AS1]|uniref:TorF family putative porin n=1 Tax=Shewanella sp. AS1 TaxID=2907626 RepID=UPI001F2D10EF|nr:TorF family putative porin [Shewanella sp. AS1]MCE9677895.1 TorF family putative porin [Shewanella sp. AS1]